MDFKEIIPERYRCKYDISNDRWIVLDTWHPQIKNLPDYNEKIPDDSPALKIITGSEMSAIIGEMKRLGYLNKIIIPSDNDDIIDSVSNKLVDKMNTLINLLSDTKKGGKREKKPILNC